VGRLCHDASQGACLHACRRRRVEPAVGFLSLPGKGLRCIPGCPAPLAKAIAFATAQRCRLAGRGPKPPACVRPAAGGRWPSLCLGDRSCETWSLAGRGNAVRFGVRPDRGSLTPKHMGFRFGPAARRKSACTYHRREMIRTAASTHLARFVPTPPHLAKEMRLQMLNSH
jgi:hypothetical protein